MTETRYFETDATISACGLYRYSLTRIWGFNARRFVIIMLNPSTADGREDDPTIRRCVGFARREDCDVLEVINLYAFRATDPKALRAADDPIGTMNARYQELAFRRYDRAVCAWGAHADPGDARDFIDRHPNVRFECLGTTKDGAPKHPLYLAADTPLQPFTMEAINR